MMARSLSWIISILLHTVFAVVLSYGVHYPDLPLEKLMEVELTRVLPQEDIVVVKTPLPPPPSPVQEQKQASDSPQVAQALPENETIVLDDAPPPPLTPPSQSIPVEPEQPQAAPDFEPISPVKVAEDEKLQPQVSQPVADAPSVEDAVNRIDVRKGDTIVHRGHEARFGRALMADYYSYSSTEFSGQFKTQDDRTITIIDARDTEYGRFLIYDSKHKTLRRLKEFGKYVYTIGPSVYADEPIIGTVTFLAKNDRIERFILTSDDDRMAHYPRKVHIREQEVQLPTNHGIRTAYVSMPPYGDGQPGVVLVQGNRCVQPGLVQGVTRALSSNNLCALSFQPRQCTGDVERKDTDAEIVEDIRAAVAHFPSLARVDTSRVGLWGHGQGVPLAIRAVRAGGALQPAFLVCMLNENVNVDEMPTKAVLNELSMPVMWFFSGSEVGRWNDFVDTLEALRDSVGKEFTIVMAPMRKKGKAAEVLGSNAAWVENVAEDHIRVVASWIKGRSR